MHDRQGEKRNLISLGEVMNIKIMDGFLDLSDRNSDCQEMLNQLHIMLEAAQLTVDYMIVDGVEVMQDYQGYLAEHWEQIQEIEVKTKTQQEFAVEYLVSATQYLQRVIPEVKSLADQFYQGASNLTWHKFEQLLEGLQWLTEIYSIIPNLNSPVNWNEYGKTVISLLGKLGELGEAMQNSDQVLIADLILYEITPVLEEIQLQIAMILGSKEQKDDLS